MLLCVCVCRVGKLGGSGLEDGEQRGCCIWEGAAGVAATATAVASDRQPRGWGRGKREEERRVVLLYGRVEGRGAERRPGRINERGGSKGEACCFHSAPSTLDAWPAPVPAPLVLISLPFSLSLQHTLLSSPSTSPLQWTIPPTMTRSHSRNTLHIVLSTLQSLSPPGTITSTPRHPPRLHQTNPACIPSSTIQLIISTTPHPSSSTSPLVLSSPSTTTTPP